MLVNGKRALAYTARCGAIRPIEGADNIELMAVNGWNVIVKKGEFEEGNLCVYFEIDSKLPAREWSEFMIKKGYKVKTMKLNKFGVVSQGLALPIDVFGIYIPDVENIDLTDKLEVTYSVEEDNKRKAEINKYDKMRQRHYNLFKKNKLVRWLFARNWGRKLLFIFLGKKRDTRHWPAWVVKTDEERCQNLPHLFPGDDTSWVVTEKIDGSSTTFTIKGRGRKEEFYVCSRNVCFDTPEKADKCFYESNIYVEMAEKYNIKEVLREFLKDHNDLEFVTIQGETYGKNVQNRNYSIEGHDFMAFNLIFGYKNGEVERFNPTVMTKILSNYDIPCVPVLDVITLPETCQELLDYAASDVSKLDGGMREGIVLRTLDGKQSFKAVSNEFLLRYHQ